MCICDQYLVGLFSPDSPTKLGTPWFSLSFPLSLILHFPQLEPVSPRLPLSQRASRGRQTDGGRSRDTYPPLPLPLCHVSGAPTSSGRDKCPQSIARPRARAHTCSRDKVRGVRWDTQVVCWCGLSLASEGHADPFAGREDRESPRLGATGGSGDVQDQGGITQGTRQCEDRAAQPL